MKKFLSIFLVTVLLFSSGLMNVGAIFNEMVEKPFYSDIYMLICTDNEEIVFSKNINKQTKPASLTKIVTASVVLAECEDLTQTVTVPQECIDELKETGSSTAGLLAGEIYTVYDLLCCLLVGSANDAATTLAYFITDTDRDAFIVKMNELVVSLGCENSNFTNVHGLDDEDQYTTAFDMTLILKNAMKYEEFNEIVSKVTYDLPDSNLQVGRVIKATNYTLLSAYREYYIKHNNGGKTGFTSNAGQCLITSASNNGYNYIAVAMNGPKEDFDEDGWDENGAFIDCKTMIDWAFDNLRLVSIADSSKVVGEVKVKYGKGIDFVTICPSSSVFSLMPKGVTSGSLLVTPVEKTVPKFIKAPVKKGDVVCKGEVFYKNEVIAEIDLVAANDVKRSLFSTIGTLLGDAITSPAFVAFLFLVSAFLISATIIKNKNSKSKRKKSKYTPKNFNDFFDTNRKG